MLNLFRNTRLTIQPTIWMNCASGTIPGLTGSARSTWITPAAGCMPSRSCALHQKLLAENVFGNPHSSNPTSQVATRLIESTRQTILQFFNADPAEYTVIFSLNASGALKLVGESYPFGPGSHYLLTFDNHNSVNGIREFAHAKGAEVTYIPVALPDMRVDTESLETSLDLALGGDKGPAGRNNLFAYPAQSNFSSVLHPLEWIERAHAKGWDVLLDAAAFAPTSRLDLSKYKPDFVSLSFYKIFGYPTGIGALLARRETLKKLRRPWFAGGTITVASVQGDKYYLAEAPAAFEDGTLDYLNIPAVEIGLKHIQSIGYETIQERVRCLTGWLLDNLSAMKHASGVPLVRIYGPLNTIKRGGAVTANFFDKDGGPIDHRFIEAKANQSSHFPADRLLLQPRGGRDCPGHFQDGAGCLLHQSRPRPALEPGRFPPVHRRQIFRRGAGLGWVGQQFRGCAGILEVCRKPAGIGLMRACLSPPVPNSNPACGSGLS